MWDPQDEMLLPGELEHRKEIERREQGIPLPAPLFADLNRIGAEMNLASTLEPLAA
jgi:LDH2 family malate/lactate/ureidoglycolate dehydrogenase